MTLEEAVAEIESKFKYINGLPYAISQTGEKYVKISSVIEPYSNLPRANVEQVLVETWRSEFWRYADGKQGILYWRIRPELGEGVSTDPVSNLPGKPFLKIYARLLISDKPIKEIQYV